MLVKSFKPSPAAVLASVVAEMAKPRVVESAKKLVTNWLTVEIYLSTRPQKKRQFHLIGDANLLQTRN
jgi:hypothetical protein